MLHLHYWPTPNGKKVAIFLEEAGLAYRVVPCNIGRGDQFERSFLALNPNHRMPVLVDDEPVGGALARCSSSAGCAGRNMSSRHRQAATVL
jgi:GSH-dependent disulfide-bond oxidoreductase